jgi:hypothetical protein
MQPTAIGVVKDEFTDAEIPDWRLRERLVSLAEHLDESPAASLPKALKSAAEREAAYRFLGNQKVTMEGIIAPHARATARRCREAGTVYVVSDTTECSFSGAERGKALGRLQGNGRGFLAHVALAVSETGAPMGVVGIDVIVRDEERKQHRNTHQRKKDPTRESLRWEAMVDHASETLGDVSAIHVMDSEADIFELLSGLRSKGRRFIIRSCQPRSTEAGHLSEAVEQSTVVLSRKVRLSRRKTPTGKVWPNRRNPPREGREAKLSISCTQVSLRRPKTCAAEYPALLPVNVVRVVETDAPDGEQPVEWILFTSERVDSGLAVAAIVDGYRRRWVIEEYFKALKTGCAYEERELESLRTLTNLLGIAAVLAWRLLSLRALHRQDSTRPATDIVEAQLLEALAARLTAIGERRPFPSAATVADLMAGIARLGGHIKSNGDPGWQVLWRGYQDLLSWGAGYIRGKSITYRDLS